MMRTSLKYEYPEIMRNRTYCKITFCPYFWNAEYEAIPLE